VPLAEWLSVDFTTFLYYSFSAGFVGIRVALGIWKQSRSMPMDIFSVSWRGGKMGIHGEGRSCLGTAARTRPAEAPARGLHPVPLPAHPPTRSPHPAPCAPTSLQAMEFAHSKGKARKDGQTSVRMADVGGIGPVVGELQEVIEVRGKGRKEGVERRERGSGAGKRAGAEAEPRGAMPPAQAAGSLSRRRLDQASRSRQSCALCHSLTLIFSV
jgi:hypothetical protein